MTTYTYKKGYTLYAKRTCTRWDCILEKVDSKENNSDIGTKRVPKLIIE